MLVLNGKIDWLIHVRLHLRLHLRPHLRLHLRTFAESLKLARVCGARVKGTKS